MSIEQTAGFDVAGKETSPNYWENYRNFWDWFVGEWLKCCKSGSTHEECNNEYGQKAKAYNDFFKSKDPNAKLNFDELPEPYMGCPDNGDNNGRLEAVMLNLNPGMSTPKDKQKFYSCRERDAWQIRELVDNYKSKYSDFIKQWNCLSPEINEKAKQKYKQDICGYDWWIEGGPRIIPRVPWLKRIYGKDSINTQKIFTLELCPFHSKETREIDINKLGKPQLKEFVMKYVIDPAIKAVYENKLPFAVAIGAPYRDLFEEILGESPEKTWSHKDQIIGWPPKHNSGETVKNVNRQYRLYRLKDQIGNQARFLVTWCQAPGNNPPGENFKDIEELIREYINNPGKDPLVCNKAIVGAAQSNERSKVHDSAQNAPKTAKTTVKVGKKQQYYQNLWNGFNNWCRQNKKTWCSGNIDANCIFPSGRRGDWYLFFKVAGGQLYLGIYCTVSTHTKIQESCAEEINAAYAGVDWNDGEARKTWRCIPIPIDGDWTKPDETLFKKMANMFESVFNILEKHNLMQ